MRLLLSLIFAAGLHGCSSNQTSMDLGVRSASELLVKGEWYFHMGCGDFLEMDLKEDGTFELEILSVREGSSIAAPGGEWSFENGTFRLEWPDGTTKTQALLSISDSLLKLENPTNVEVYIREPEVEAHNNAKQAGTP